VDIIYLCLPGDLKERENIQVAKIRDGQIKTGTIIKDDSVYG